MPDEVNEAVTAATTSKPKDARPARTLPTKRVSFAKQLDILRAFCALSEPSGKSVANVEVAKIVELHASTVGLTTPFFNDIGLLQKTSEGLVPSIEVIEFTRAHEWSPDTASRRLGPIIAKAWFAQAIVPKLRFNAMGRASVIQELAMAASAGPSYRGQIEILLDYLNASGVAIVEGDQVRQGKPHHNSTDRQQSEDELVVPHAQKAAPPEGERHHVATTFATSPTAGVVQFNISVKADMSEMSNWKPERIQAFFAGVAQVLAAKGQIEENSSPNKQTAPGGG